MHCQFTKRFESLLKNFLAFETMNCRIVGSSCQRNFSQAQKKNDSKNALTAVEG